MVDIYLDENDTKRIIRNKLLKDNTCSACTLEKVLRQSNQQYQKSLSSNSEADLSNAIDFLEDKLTTNPEDLIILDRLASLSFRLGDLDSSYNYADKILQLDPDNKEAYLIRAKCFYKWGSYQDALEEINIAISLSPSSKETVDKITDHFKDPINDDTILEVEPNPELRELLQFRDQILSKMHTSMTGMYS